MYALFLLLTACGAWVPEELPMQVDMDEALPSHVKENILIVAERFEAAIGRPIVFVTERAGGSRPGRVHIRYATSGEVREGSGGHAVSSHDRCVVALVPPTRPNATPGKVLIMHELLHCLGYDHAEKGSDSIMAPNAGKGVLTAEIVDELRQRSE
jgi:hypothetical protein